ncbi:PREDICTED: uncharacterized protein LOC109216280 [Nicotiana attenuata]|uniref:uncharacterized protein LOC109216280 n=1 Tax=Nicotiana attenuata TaxID=49451 RepID=UPI00090497C4|nr:PREDICTED: uncharacterized protein LOC109216280 [Nicotiana attenuata]
MKAFDDEAVELAAYQLKDVAGACKANVVADALSRKSMGVLAHLAVQRRSLGREIQQLANDGIRLDETEEGDITAYALVQSSLVAHVKAKQDEDPYLVKLKEGVRSKEITAFTLGSDRVLKLNDRLCVPDVDGLRKAIMEEAHSSRYSIHPGATKMYLDLKELYWWKGMKKQVADHVAKCLNWQQVKAEHQRPDRLTKSAHFLPVKMTDFAEQYSQLYIKEIV